MSKDTICAPWRSGRGLSEAIFDAKGDFVASVGGRTQAEIRERSALVATAPELRDTLKLARQILMDLQAAGWVVRDDGLVMIDKIIAKSEGVAS